MITSRANRLVRPTRSRSAPRSTSSFILALHPSSFRLHPCTWSLDWEQDAEAGPARLAFQFDRAVVLGHEGLGDSKSNPMPALAPAHQRKEDPVLQFIRHTRPVVHDLHQQGQAMHPL